MEEQNKKHPLEILAENLFDRDRNYTTTNEIKEFGLAKVDYTYDEDLALHVSIQLECNKKLTWRTFPTDDFSFPELYCEVGAEKEFDRDFLSA